MDEAIRKQLDSQSESKILSAHGACSSPIIDCHMTSALAMLRRLRHNPIVLFGGLALVFVILLQVCFTPKAAASAASMSAMTADCGPAGVPQGHQVPACCQPGHLVLCAGQSLAMDTSPGYASSSALAILPVTAVRIVRLRQQSRGRSPEPADFRTPSSQALYLRHGRFLI